MTEGLFLPTVSPAELPSIERAPFDDETLSQAQRIVDDVVKRGEIALREHALRLGDISAGDKLIYSRADLEDALRQQPEETRELLKRTAGRIRVFALAQLQSCTDLQVEVSGGFAGHRFHPLDSAGCYAPGGRFPLPSSVLMTAVTARAAGVEEVLVASPRPSVVTLAAAAVAGADALLAAGGAQAIAALAYGAGQVPACSIVVGPGNRWVTAAKYLVSQRTAIDQLAGPTELVIVADSSADPSILAADLLAQAEHDEDALPILVSLDEALIQHVRAAISDQLQSLDTAGSARTSLSKGFSVVVPDIQSAVSVSNQLAPEHLMLVIQNAHKYAKAFCRYGTIFFGQASAPAFCDYGAGPNHVLPTGGTARFRGGLSVFDFLRPRTWLRITDPHAVSELAEDTIRLAELEGLSAHSASVRRRLR